MRISVETFDGDYRWITWDEIADISPAGSVHKHSCVTLSDGLKIFLSHEQSIQPVVEFWREGYIKNNY